MHAVNRDPFRRLVIRQYFSPAGAPRMHALLWYAVRRLLGGRDVTNIDLKLLAIVNELHKTRSVSQTAENLDLSQSAISMSLAKLRKHFNDPLFVRTSSGMNPTPHAVELIGLLKSAEGILQTALDLHVVFDPLTSERRCHRRSPVGWWRSRNRDWPRDWQPRREPPATPRRTPRPRP